MNYKKIIICTAFALMALASQASSMVKARKTTTATAAPTNIYWTDGYGKVTYNINAQTSPVVKIALREFAHDMKMVTGFEAKEKAGAPIQIYQLDLLTNKEFATVEKLGAPLHKIITAKDAYYIGTRNKKVIVIGCDARGTAYAIMHLSKLAGVSPWAAWNDLKPQTRRSLYTPSGQEWIEIPRIEYRGFTLNNSMWLKPHNYSLVARLMLRLRANTLWQVDGKHEAAYNKAVVDSFEICMAENYKVVEQTGKKHNKKQKKNIETVKMVCDDSQLSIENLSPGLLREILESKDFMMSKSTAHHEKSHRTDSRKGEAGAWIAQVTNPKKAALQLAIMMDLAWDKEVLKKGCSLYLQNWLCQQFGEMTGKNILPLMVEYYRLSSIRQPAYMTMPYDESEFHSGEFGNELERYLYRYDQLKAKTESIERSLPAEQKDGFFEVVKYPIFSAALIAEKELEAQEARHIARPGLFNNDNEAKAAAAVSITAYEKLKQLNNYYGSICKGKWRNFIPMNEAGMQLPSLPGTISASDIVKYRKDAFDRTEDLKSLSLSTSDIIAKNAWEWTTVSNAPAVNGKPYEEIKTAPLLGHSNKAVKLPKGASLCYNFYSNQSGDARFTLATIPGYAANNKSMRVSVSIDHAEPVVCQLQEVYNSKQWKLDLWRGQALKSFYVTLPCGNHNIEIKALDDNIIVDQWILDYDVDREYYVIPVAK